MKRMVCVSNSLRSVGILLVLLAGIQLSATTLLVGNCKVSGYPTIQQAVNAAPVGATVQVCPGTYLEQVTITQAVTLQGITANNGDRAFIGPPFPDGLFPNATDLFGDQVSAQVLVKDSAGPVNISNLWVDGSGNMAYPSSLVAGIYYQNSPGTINGVTVMDQYGNNLGIGIFLEGGASSPTVTVQNSYVKGFDYAGIDFETIHQPNTALTAKITNNSVILQPPKPPNAQITGIQFGEGATATVSGNSVVADTPNAIRFGLQIGPGAAGSVSGNIVTATDVALETSADEISVTSNKLLNSSGTGISVRTSIGAIKSNLIIGVNEYGAGINFHCFSNPNVRSNTINFTDNGLSFVPTSLSTSTNKVFNTTTVRTGGCP